MQEEKDNKIIRKLKQKSTIVVAVTILIATIASYYASEHIGVYLIRQPDSVLFSIISNISATILLPGFILFIIFGGRVHAGINYIYEKLILVVGSCVVWTYLVLCSASIMKNIWNGFFQRRR
jgi:hypothetical protein